VSTIFEEIVKVLFVGLLIGFFIWFSGQQLKIMAKLMGNLNEQREEIKAIKLENIELKAEQEKIVKEFTVLTKLTDAQRKDLVASKLSERLADTNNGLSELKDIMLQTPEKAIKIERLQVKQEAEFKILENKISSLKDQFSTLQSLLYLLVGFIVALLIYVWRKAHKEDVSLPKNCTT